MAAVFALTVAACSNGGSGSGSDTQTEPGTDAPDEAEPAAETALQTNAGASSPIGNVLTLVADDNDEPADGTDVQLFFEPEDVATLYIQADDDTTFVAHGSWSYTDGELSLSFSHEQLTVDAVAPFDLDADTVTFPFRLLDGGTDGSSEWSRRPADPVTDLRPIFRAAVLDDTDPRETADGIDRATAYAQALIDLEGPATGGRARAAADPTSAVPVRAGSLVNGIEIEYSDGTSAQVLVFGWAPPGPDPLSLTTGALAGDPRVHLNMQPSAHTQDDPANKTAMFVVPLKTGRINDWWDRLTNSARDTGIVGTTSDPFDLDAAEQTLTDRGYNVARYEDEKACVLCLVEAFTEHKNPGFVLLQSHGTSNGYLLAGDQLAEDDDWDAAHEQFEALQEKLRDEGHGSLVDTPDALSMMSIETEMKVPEGVVWFAAVGPGFWQWLRTQQGADFSQSLVYAAACELDNEPALRESIMARAFFGFKTSISPALAGGIFDYMVAHLARHTRSAEEAFYNIVRVVNTGEMIFAEDKELDGVAPSDASGSIPLFGEPEEFQFNGYASDGASAPQPYAMHGWFDTSSVSQTQVWWLLFAARWNENVDEGVQNLVTCHLEYWSQGEYGGLGSPFCNAANDGDLPTEAEIGLATYLMAGAAAAPTTATLPRFTLNEGA